MKKYLTLVLALVMLFSLAACGSGTTQPTSDPSSQGSSAPGGNANGEPAASDGPKVLRVGTTDSGGSFDPWSGTSGPQNYLGFETIVMRDGAGDYEPWLAQSVEWVDDTILRVVLNPNAKFSNGEQVLGEDVVYTFYKSATAASVMAVHFSVIDFDATTISEDGLTVDFKLKQAYGPLLAYLDIPYVVDKSQCEDWAADDARWWDSPPTSSAYEITENVSGSHTTFTLRENYWNTERMPDWDQIIINYYSDSTAMFVAFESGELDVVLNVAATDVSRLESGATQNASSAAYELLPSRSNYLMCLSDNKTELRDAKVREAIAHVVDGNAVGLVAFGGYYKMADSVICEGIKHYKSTGAYELNVDYAKQCMAESAYPNGFTLDVVSMAADAPIWDVIADCLSKIGISVNVSSYDMATCVGMWMAPEGNDCMLITCAGGNVTGEPYADLSANWQNGMLTAARVMDADYNALFEKFVYNTDEAIREDYCQQVQQWLHDNYECIPLCQPLYCYAYNTDVVESCSFFSGMRANMLYCKAK